MSAHGSVNVNWQEDDSENDSMDALISSQLSHKPNTKRRTKKQTRLVASAVAAVLLVFFVSCSLPRSSPRGTSRLKLNLPRAVQKQGWVGAVEQFRVELIDLLLTLKKHEDATSVDSKYVEISPVYERIEYALDTFGMRSVYTEVFEGLEFYYPRKWHKHKDDCDTHGMQCYWQDPWWLWHYVGAISAEKLLRDGSLLLDGITGERLYDGVSVMNEIHRIQEQPYVSAMSFHAEHGFIWTYLAVTQPDIKSYPTELSDEFCGKYKHKKVSTKPASKTVGYECYHGFGHAVYSVIAMRQSGENFSNYNARTQVRPHGGFSLTDESFCAAYKICETAPTDTKNPQKACFGGIRHSYKLFSNTLPKFATKFDNQKYFLDLYDRVC